MEAPSDINTNMGRNISWPVRIPPTPFTFGRYLVQTNDVDRLFRLTGTPGSESGRLFGRYALLLTMRCALILPVLVVGHRNLLSNKSPCRGEQQTYTDL
jgi:hypothetical protein